VTRWRWFAAALAVALVVVAAAVIAARGRSGASERTLGTLPVASGLGLRCTLPVFIDGRLATLSLPAGQLTAAPVQPGPNDQGRSFAGGRWLPVGRQAVSPDARSYAYLTTTTGVPGQPAVSTLFVHDVGAGRDRPVWSGDGQARDVQWAREGIFFNRIDRGFDLWSVDPGRPGSAHRVGPNPPIEPGPGQPPVFFGAVANGTAWALVPSAFSGNGSVTNDVVLRMDLADGTISRWYQAPPGNTLTILGLDGGGHPLLGVADPMSQVGNIGYEHPAKAMLLLSGRDQAVPIALPDPSLGPDGALTDAHGTWVAGADALWLYRDGRLVRVATVPARLRPPTPRLSLPPGAPGPARGSAAALLGPCT
jgi:hypothetical protein